MYDLKLVSMEFPRSSLLFLLDHVYNRFPGTINDSF